MDSIPESGRCPGGGNGNPLQYSHLENSMEPGGLQSTGCKESDMIREVEINNIQDIV